jgi:hypothetical protein
MCIWLINFIYFFSLENLINIIKLIFIYETNELCANNPSVLLFFPNYILEFKFIFGSKL